MCFQSKAQFTKGQVLLGGNVGFSTTKANNSGDFTTSNNGFNINPSIAVFKKSNQLIGLGLSYNYSLQKNKSNANSNENGSNSHTIGINAFAQRFYTLSNKFFFTVKGNAGIGYTTGKQYNYNGIDRVEAKTNGYRIGLDFSPGISYTVTPRLLFDASLNSVLSLNYSHTKTDNPFPGMEYTRTQNAFNIDSDLSNTSLGNIGIGFRWFLKK